MRRAVSFLLLSAGHDRRPRRSLLLRPGPRPCPSRRSRSRRALRPADPRGHGDADDRARRPGGVDASSSTRGGSTCPGSRPGSGRRSAPTRFEVGAADAILGAPLTIALPAGADRVRVRYATRPGASGLQWLAPPQTAGKKHPFLFSQSAGDPRAQLDPDPGHAAGPHHLRRDGPDAARARRRDERGGQPDGAARRDVPVLDAAADSGVPARDRGGRPRASRRSARGPASTRSRRSSPAAAHEFADTERMMEAAERLYGPYRWDRYDILVLPPSFPFGGMENPRLTFATPTVLAGDRSLVSLIAHELAHSWSGNLVTNATWSDFWLNEGFTTYIERRIVEEVYGADVAPDGGGARAPGPRGRDRTPRGPRRDPAHRPVGSRPGRRRHAPALREGRVSSCDPSRSSSGAARFDEFLRGYFDHFAFQSITTADFVAYLRENLFVGGRRPGRDGPARGVDRDARACRPRRRAPVSEALDAWPAAAPRTGAAGRSRRPDVPFAALDARRNGCSFCGGFRRRCRSTGCAELDDGLRADRDRQRRDRLPVAPDGAPQRVRAPPTPGSRSSSSRSAAASSSSRSTRSSSKTVPDGRDRGLAIYRKARPGYHPISVDTRGPHRGMAGDELRGPASRRGTSRAPARSTARTPAASTSRVEGGRVVAIGGSRVNPVTQGYICAKVRRIPRAPLRGGAHPPSRDPRGAQGRGEVPSARRGTRRSTSSPPGCKSVRDGRGGEGILPFSYGGSNGYLSQDTTDARLFYRLGASRLARTVCAAPSAARQRRPLREDDRASPIPDYAHGEADRPLGHQSLGLGHPPPAVHPGGAEERRPARRSSIRGGRGMAERADLHLAPHPGTDLPLALAVIRWLFAERPRRPRVSRGARDRRRASSSAAPSAWTLERAAAETRVPAADIERFAAPLRRVVPGGAAVRLGARAQPQRRLGDGGDPGAAGRGREVRRARRRLHPVQLLRLAGAEGPGGRSCGGAGDARRST